MQQQYLAVAKHVRQYLESSQSRQQGIRRTARFRWRHTLRVLATAREIGKAEGANIEIVELAALLHDIAKLDPRSQQVHHAILGSQMAAEYLEQLGMTQQKVQRVAEAVRYHSYDTHRDGLALETLVLKDADRLDEVGALDILQAGMQAGERSMDYRESHMQGLKQLKHMRNVPFFTATGRRMVAQRLKIMEDFWRQAEAELAGEEMPPYGKI